MSEVIDVQEGVQAAWIGESIVFQTDYQDANGNNMLDAQPSAVANAKLYNASGTDVTSTQATGSASLSAWVLTWPTMTPTTTGKYQWIANLTVGGNTLITRIVIMVHAAPPN